MRTVAVVPMDGMTGGVTRTPLPGLGVRYEFVTKDGVRVGVLHKRSGARELVIFERDDPAAPRRIIRLGAADCRTIAELLVRGPSRADRAPRRDTAG